MKRRICLIIAGIILVAILAFAFYKLSAGDSFEKTLVSSEWYVQMSEGRPRYIRFIKTERLTVRRISRWGSKRQV